MAGEAVTWPILEPALVACAITAAAWGITALVLSRITHRNNIIDTLWSLGFAIIVITALLSSLGHGNAVRRTALLICTLVWSLRLGWFVGRRSAGRGDDQRYIDLLARHRGGPLLLIFAPQTVLLFVISLTLQVGLVEPGRFGVLGWVGVLVWLVGLLFESVGDRQMDRFRRNLNNRGTLIDEGLWRWTRHPNYFGDAAVWAGLFIVTAERWPGVLTFFSPLIMIYLLAFGSGARLLERAMRTRPGYDAYMCRTSGFVPMPPGLHQLICKRQTTSSS